MVMIVMVFVLLMRMLVVMVVMRMLVLRLIGGVLGAHLLQQLVRQGHLFNGRQDGLAVQLVPGGGAVSYTHLVGVSYAGAFPEGTELQPLEGM